MPKCEKCMGAGQVICKTCAGAGSYAGVAIGVDAMLTPCPKCAATGKVTCRTCGGSGIVG
jgi:DnaJ-class molecular chaperone